MISGAPVTVDSLPGQAHIVPTPFVIAEDGSDFPLRNLEEAAASCAEMGSTCLSFANQESNVCLFVYCNDSGLHSAMQISDCGNSSVVSPSPWPTFCT